jgi:hypothetical protein
MRHPYFRDLKDTDKRGVAAITDKAAAKTESSDTRSVESDVEKGTLGGLVYYICICMRIHVYLYI